jgi:ABC-2 type transport system permease protein
MFRHLFINNLKSIIRSKETLFWTLLFPIVLATLFYFAFGNLNASDEFELIPIGIVRNAGFEEGSTFYLTLASVSDIDGAAGSGDLFHAEYLTMEEADEKLKSGDISAYLTYENDIKMNVSDSGFDQTLIKLFLDKYKQTSSTVQSILAENPGISAESLISDIHREEDYLKEISPSSAGNPDTKVLYFYSLLAMTCLMGSTISIEEVMKLQANMSPLAARVNVSPVPKFRHFLYNISAAILFQMIAILLVLVYVIFILRIDFGEKAAFILLNCLIGCMTGILFGTTVSVGFKTTGIKYGITIGGTMLSCFLSGMMASDIKYLISQNAPIVGYLSPATLISDAFYSLYYYDGFSRYFVNIAILCALCVLFGVITCVVLRRKTYASI